MITLLFSAVCFSLLASFFCSLVEAALFAVPLAYAKGLAEQGSRGAQSLVVLKEDIERPITAILILSTVANTGGASVAGSVAGILWGEIGLMVFSVLFSLTLLYIAEVTPKFLGVVYARQVAVLVAIPLTGLVRLFSPLILISAAISRRLQPRSGQKVSYQEVLSLAAMGAEEGSIDKLEGSVISNVIGLDGVFVRDLLTPRVAVFRMKADRCIGDLESEIPNWQYTRVPLFTDDDSEHLTRYVRQRDIYREFVRGRRDLRLVDVSRPLSTVPELARVDKVLIEMIEKRDHICAVVDEHGSFAGVITLEDILEEIVGHEILDEYDLTEGELNQ